MNKSNVILSLLENWKKRLTDQYKEYPEVAQYYFGLPKLPKLIKVWRATNNEKILPGDYVSADKEFAKIHMRDSSYKLVSIMVPPEHLRIISTSAGKGYTEFIYEP